MPAALLRLRGSQQHGPRGGRHDRYEKISDAWDSDRDERFFRITARLLPSSFVEAASALLASYDDEPAVPSTGDRNTEGGRRRCPNDPADPRGRLTVPPTVSTSARTAGADGSSSNSRHQWARTTAWAQSRRSSCCSSWVRCDSSVASLMYGSASYVTGANLVVDQHAVLNLSHAPS